MARITIYQEHGIWIADMTQAADADGTMELFGTHHLPTPFTVLTPSEKVIAELRGLNPGHDIVLKKMLKNSVKL